MFVKNSCSTFRRHARWTDKLPREIFNEAFLELVATNIVVATIVFVGVK